MTFTENNGCTFCGSDAHMTSVCPMRKAAINLGALDPQQRLDVARGLPAPSVAGMDDHFRESTEKVVGVDGWRWANGFPPPGELCEARIPHHTSDGMQMLWCEVEVIAHAIIKGVVYSWVKEPGPDGAFIAPLMLSFRMLSAAPVPPVQGDFNPEHTLFNEIRTSSPFSDDDAPAGYLISEQQLQRIRALEFGQPTVQVVKCQVCEDTGTFPFDSPCPECQPPAQVDEREACMAFQNGSHGADIQVTIEVCGDGETSPSEALHQALRSLYYAGLIKSWSQPEPAAPSADGGKVESDEVRRLREALEFYANGDHLLLADPDSWDTCSGEPMNFLHDDAGTASVEDGSIARQALAALSAHRGEGERG